jgi:pSer/pThr/pTyr-binding forkhead associated (FHA) protein
MFVEGGKTPTSRLIGFQKTRSQRLHSRQDITTVLRGIVRSERGSMIATLGLNNGSSAKGFKAFAEGQTVIVGAAADCDIVLEDWLIAARHFAVTNRGSDFQIQVLDHLVAVLVNGRAVQTQRLHHRDLISVGHFRFALTIDRSGLSVPRVSTPSIRRTSNVSPVSGGLPARNRTSEMSSSGDSDFFNPSASIVRVGETILLRESVHGVSRREHSDRKSSELN